MNSVLRFLWNARYEIATGLLAFSTAGLVILMILASRSVLLSELQWHFERSALLEGNINQIMLVSKYQNQSDLYRETIDPQRIDEQELQLGKVLATDRAGSDGAFSFTNPLSHAAAGAINAFRLILGKGSLPTELEITTNQQLYQAFRLEYSLQYNKALEIYTLLESRTTDPVLQGVIQLHQGFCHAMLGNDSLGRNYFQLVQHLHPGTDLAWTAQKLLVHMDALQKERVLLHSSDLPRFQKAQKYVYLMDCDVAMNILDSLPPEQREQAEALVLQGRCAEEKGQPRQAAQNYLKAVAAARNSPLARQANRRLFLLSERAPDTLSLKSVALRLNTTLQDSVITRFENTLAEKDSESTERSPAVLAPELVAASQAALQAVATPVVEIKPLEKLPKPVAVRVETPPAPPQEKITVLKQKNGTLITGTIVSAPGAPLVLIRTLVGVVGIPRSEIDSSHVP